MRFFLFKAAGIEPLRVRRREFRLPVGRLLIGAGLSLCFFPTLPAQASDTAVLPYVQTNLRERASRLSEPTPAPPTDPVDISALKGWHFLYERMVALGADPARLAVMLADERMPKRETLYFSLNPRESKHLYRKHNTPANRRNAARFYRKHYRYFKNAAQRYGVPESVILAILQVETHCGSYTGQSRTFYRLARLASAADPDNVTANYNVHKTKDPKVSRKDVEKRAAWLTEEFLPHVLGTIHLADQMQIHPLEVRGSSAGAVGLPQFLPNNVLTLGQDGNRDGKVDLFDPADAIYSVAHYLREHGWRGDTPLTLDKRRQVIWTYNRSDSYIDTVLAIADMLEPQLASIGGELERLFADLAVQNVIARRLP